MPSCVRLAALDASLIEAVVIFDSGWLPPVAMTLRPGGLLLPAPATAGPHLSPKAQPTPFAGAVLSREHFEIPGVPQTEHP
jgi:hypothetical protein